MAPFLLMHFSEFVNSTDLPNEGLAPFPRRMAPHAIDRRANDGLPRE
jgi:hypothetical protein